MNLLEPMKIHNFLHMVLRILNTHVLDWIVVLCLWSDKSEFGALFVVLNLWNVPGFIFELYG